MLVFLNFFRVCLFVAMFIPEVDRDDRKADGWHDEGELHGSGKVRYPSLNGWHDGTTDQRHNDEGTTSFGVLLFVNLVQRVSVDRWPFRTEEEARRNGCVNGRRVWNRKGNYQANHPKSGEPGQHLGNRVAVHEPVGNQLADESGNVAVDHKR